MSDQQNVLLRTQSTSASPSGVAGPSGEVSNHANLARSLLEDVDEEVNAAAMNEQGPFPNQRTTGMDPPDEIRSPVFPHLDLPQTQGSSRALEAPDLVKGQVPPLKMVRETVFNGYMLPDFDDFTAHIVELYPMLPPYLVARIAHDQVRRYKRLVKNRVDHLNLCTHGNTCPSGVLCVALGGEAEELPKVLFRSATKTLTSTLGVNSDSEDSAADNVVTPALFPDGIPLPPAKRLPARLECPLCFQVKTFREGSDWTRHVLEDIQPFTCTFSNCVEPGAFKRKADWVRHENERHRHLEWWSCNISECTHKCYRKDNFVQHLVREHKCKEPKVKGRVSGNANDRGKNSIGGFNQEEQEFWNLVDSCRHEGAMDPKSEPCKFCNLVCTTWKKLIVHVAKHMEKIAMPVLDLAQRRNVSEDTVISPVNPPLSVVPETFGMLPPEDMGLAYVAPITFSGLSEFGNSADSGYASWCPPMDQTFSDQEPQDLLRLSEPDPSEAFETRTTYSGGISIGTTMRDDFVHRFADMLWNDLIQQGVDNVAGSISSSDIDELLADFSIRLGQGDTKLELHQVVVFIHKYRSSISRAFQELSHAASDEDSEEEHSISSKPPLHEIMQMWRDRAHGVNDEPPIFDEPVIVGSSPEELSDPFEKDVQNYERLIAMTPAYQWLVASIRKNSLLVTTSGSSVDMIRMEVRKHVHKPSHLSKSSAYRSAMLTEVQFEIDWELAILDDKKDDRILDSILTVTGAGQEAQAMTCAQYIRQTWPTNGPLLWHLTKDALLNPDKIVYNQVDNTCMSARCQNSRLIVRVRGVRGVLVEAAEQLCWTSGALKSAFSSFDNGILLCLPSLERTDQSPLDRRHTSSWSHSGEGHYTHYPDAQDLPPLRLSQLAAVKQKPTDNRKTQVAVHFKINTEYKKHDAISQPGTCWQYLFKKCVIIQGFPIRRRSRPELGLELTLELMAELIGTKYLQQFNEHLFFKQFFIMLTPSTQVGDLLVWHLCKTRDGDRISYLDHGLRDLCKTNYDDVVKARHIIGWCSNIKHFAGHADGCYDVENSLLEESPPSGSLFNCHLSFGRRVSGGSDVSFSANHQCVSFSQRNYLDMFRFLERRSILLWDIGTSRGWLINGLRVLLHVIRQSFRIDENKNTGGMFVLKPGDLLEPKQPCSARAAREFLNNPTNMSTKISISGIHGTDYVYETLSQRFERIYDIFEQAFEHQSRRRDWDQIPRSYLEGWDFLSLARRDDTIPPSMFTLPSLAKDWVDFVRATGTVTLMGDGFGELLQPGAITCNSMPCDRFYLAISVSDLPELARSNRCQLGTRRRLICRSPMIIWYSPPGSSRRCACADMEESKTMRPLCVQVMWPAEQTASLPAEDDIFVLEEHTNGAVIFGHDNSLQFYLPELGRTPLSGPVPQAAKELELVDSGIGSSLKSLSTLETVRTKSTSSPFGHSQSTLAVRDDQCNSYGSSSMSGGYGIYGNVTGNFSVHQYFGPVPNHDRSCGPPPPIPLSPSKLNSTSYQVRDGDTWRWRSEEQAPAISPEQELHDGTDFELQRGQIEVGALGLQNYCSVFRF